MVNVHSFVNYYFLVNIKDYLFLEFDIPYQHNSKNPFKMEQLINIKQNFYKFIVGNMSLC